MLKSSGYNNFEVLFLLLDEAEEKIKNNNENKNIKILKEDINNGDFRHYQEIIELENIKETLKKEREILFFNLKKETNESKRKEINQNIENKNKEIDENEKKLSTKAEEIKKKLLESFKKYDKAIEENEKNFSDSYEKREKINLFLKSLNFWPYCEYLILKNDNKYIEEFEEKFKNKYVFEYFQSLIFNKKNELINKFEENSVGYVSYYDYLCLKKEEKEIEAFENALIKDAILYGQNIIKNKDSLLKNPSNDFTYFLNALKKAIKREKEFEKKHVSFILFSRDFSDY